MTSIRSMLPPVGFTFTLSLLFMSMVTTSRAQNLIASTGLNPESSSSSSSSSSTTSSDTVHIECNSNSILLTLTSGSFNGLIYPKGLSTNSSCMVEYTDVGSVTYVLPLRSCNTMSQEVDGGIEYFNTVVIQPHRRLVTNQGKGFHVRCRYNTKGAMITASNASGHNPNGTTSTFITGHHPLVGTGYNVSSLTGTTPVLAQAPVPIPACSMKILMTESGDEMVAESVKIGDKLTLTIHIDNQDVYGMKVTNCLVRDGLNWGEQPLLNDEGCPVDDEIMGPFEYSLNKTKATVSFQAHKFPYTSSVYYQCNVRLCLKESGGCEDVPPDCEQNGIAYRRRRRRDVDLRGEDGNLASVRQEDAKDLSIEVYSGLYVNENEDNNNDGPFNHSNSKNARRIGSEEEFCISMRKFAIGVAIASLLLMLAVILLVACILQRRKTRKGSSTASSIYSGPYSNRGYSRD